MIRCLKTFAVSVIFLVLTSVVGFVAKYIPLGFWAIFGIATGALAVGIILTFAVRGNKAIKSLVILINAVSMGFYLRSWYINRVFDNPLWLMLCVALLVSAYMIVFMLPLYIKFINNHYGWYLLIFTILSVAGYVCLVIFTKTTWVSTLGYFGLLQLGFIITMSMNGDDQLSLLTSWQVASYTVAVCAIIILIIVLGADSAGDFLDGFSGGGSNSRGISSPKKKGKIKSENAESFIDMNL